MRIFSKSVGLQVALMSNIVRQYATAAYTSQTIIARWNNRYIKHIRIP